MRFNIDDYKGKYAMHCKTEEEAKDFCNHLDKCGRKWCSDLSYLWHTNWYMYNEDMAYSFNSGEYCHVDYYQANGYTILEWEDFMKHTFTKADLKTGDVILHKSGDVEIVIKELGVRVRPIECNRLADINDDLTHSFLPSEDIVAVRRPNSPMDCRFEAFKEKRGTLIYEREEVEEMTLAEVCKLLGKNIKIIK